MEYQGYWHLIDQAPVEDARRIARFGAMNMTVVEIWKEDFTNGRVSQKLHDGHRSALARDPRLDAWQCPRARG